MYFTHGTDDYLLMHQSNSDAENRTVFDDVLDYITEEEYDEFFVTDNEHFLSS